MTLLTTAAILVSQQATSVTMTLPKKQAPAERIVTGSLSSASMQCTSWSLFTVRATVDLNAPTYKQYDFTFEHSNVYLH